MRRITLACSTFAVKVTVFRGVTLDMEVLRGGDIEKHLYAYVGAPYQHLRNLVREYES